VAEPLDYEVTREYVLTVEAVDGGTPPLSSTSAVIITVTDANDNVPAFTQTEYQTSVLEDVAVDSTLLTVG